MALTMGRSAMLKEVQGEFGIDGQLENAVWDKSFSLKGLQVQIGRSVEKRSPHAPSLTPSAPTP